MDVPRGLAHSSLATSGARRVETLRARITTNIGLLWFLFTTSTRALRVPTCQAYPLLLVSSTLFGCTESCGWALPFACLTRDCDAVRARITTNMESLWFLLTASTRALRVLTCQAYPILPVFGTLSGFTKSCGWALLFACLTHDSDASDAVRARISTNMGSLWFLLTASTRTYRIFALQAHPLPLIFFFISLFAEVFSGAFLFAYVTADLQLAMHTVWTSVTSDVGFVWLLLTPRSRALGIVTILADQLLSYFVWQC